MKIALITHHFPPSFKAGAEQYAYRITQGLQRLGHTVEVVTIESITVGSPTPSCETEIYADLSVHRLRFDVSQAPDRFEWSFRNPHLGRWVKDYLQQYQPDIVHINSGYLLGGTVPEAASELGLPTALTLHDYWFLCPLHTLLRPTGGVCEEPVSPARCVWCSLSEQRRYRLPDQRLGGHVGNAFVKLSQSKQLARLMGVVPRLELMETRRAYLKQVIEKIDLVISPSRFLIDKVLAYGFQPRRLVHLPFGMDHNHLERLVNPQVKTENPRTGLRIGYLGQFVPHKGVHLLLAAFQRLTKSSGACELTLHGRISDSSVYEQQLLQMAENDPRIRFAGPYPNTEVGQVLNNLDVIVVPSIWYENRPTVIVEALATGTPVIATRLGGMAELIKHNENGLLFEVGNIEDLTGQLQRLLAEPDLLFRLRRGIQPIPTIGHEIEELTSHYTALLKS